MKNSERVRNGFDLLHAPMVDFIYAAMKKVRGKHWWEDVKLKLYKEDLPDSAEPDDVKLDSLDLARCFKLINSLWNEFFFPIMPKKARSWANELLDYRNSTAHKGPKDIKPNDAISALDSMWQLCEVCEPKETGGDKKAAAPSVQILNMMYDAQRENLYGTEAGSMAADAPKAPEPAEKKAGGAPPALGALPSWRNVAEPHPDVWQGRYKNAEFAADLAQVARGEGALEYKDPVEFFARTYMTDGINGLIAEAMKRVENLGGDPVIQLKTAFGGGKTHSMLALYHALRGHASLEKVPNLRAAVKLAGITEDGYLPRAQVAVIVGTAIDPTVTRTPEDMPGVTIHTIWGEIAYQLARSAREPAIYEMIRASDEAGTSPGSETLKNMLDKAGPCMILMDELVAYGRNIFDKKGLPCGSFDSFIVFIQHITEAARASRDSLVVASIPESDSEIGGEAGQKTLRQIQQMFGRVERVWRPVAAEESFEIVRRRLFKGITNEAARDEICASFAAMYRDNEADFPPETKEPAYEARMRACYPIHPEIFDRLYSDWSTIPGFQRTRGVLRLMATLIHELWSRADGCPMIMPGSFALDAPDVRSELMRHLPDTWNSIIDNEVDGDGSSPVRKDEEDGGRYGKQQACRRTARAIMLGSAPTSRSQNVRGIEDARVNLGVVMPGENISVYVDARKQYMIKSLAYLFTDGAGARYWYDTRPNLNRTAEERASLVPPEAIDEFIKKEIKKQSAGSSISAVHVWPASSDIPDDDSEIHLVVLNTRDAYDPRAADGGEARAAAEEIYKYRGSPIQRLYRNMIVFAAADKDLCPSMDAAVRTYLAWNAIKRDSATLNLDASQNKEVDTRLAQSLAAASTRITETYRWVMAPSIDLPEEDDIKEGKSETGELRWNSYLISSGEGGIAARAGKKLIEQEALIDSLSPMTLLVDLDNRLWKDEDDIQVGKLWKYFCQYCHLPRLASFGVLKKTIVAGVNSTEYFGSAAGKSGDHYVELKWNEQIGSVDKTFLIVKREAAMKQKLLEVSRSQQEDPVSTPPTPTPKPPVKPKNTHFGMSASIDTMRGVDDMNSLWDDVIKHLVNADGTKVKITISVTADSDDGIPADTIRTVMENCKTRNVNEYGVD